MATLKETLENIKANAEAIVNKPLDGMEALRELMASGRAYDYPTRTLYTIDDQVNRVVALRDSLEQGHAGHSARSYLAALRWLIKPIDDDLTVTTDRASVVTKKGEVFDTPTEVAQCPFGCGKATRLPSAIYDAEGRKEVSWRWEACEHFIGSRTEVDALYQPYTEAYFAMVDARLCDNCDDAYNHWDDEVCWSCGGQTSDDRYVETEPRDDD